MTEPSPPPPEAGDVSFARTLLQFFVIPMLVVILGVGIFLGFAWLVSDDTTAAEQLQRIRSGGHREARQAAFELANRIQHGDPAEFRALGPDLVQAFEDAAPPADPWVRQYLALARDEGTRLVTADRALEAIVSEQVPEVEAIALQNRAAMAAAMAGVARPPASRPTG